MSAVYVDTHCHLDFEPLSLDVPAVMQRAAGCGVTRVVAPAYDVKSWDDVAMSAAVPGVYPAFGLHPWAAGDRLDMNRLAEYLQKYRAVAIGEIGLDSKVGLVEGAVNAGRERQLEVLRLQLDLALELDLPVLLHCRGGAFDDMINELEKRKPRLRGIIHAYSRGPELARRFIGLGMHLAFGGAVTRSNADRARRSAQITPEDRLLLETDAPAIALENVEASLVEPRHIVDIAWALAEVRKTSLEEIASTTTRNAEALFRFP